MTHKGKEKTMRQKVMKNRAKLKNLKNCYEDHLNEYLPENIHRGDIASSNRMLAYSDTLLATCATFLVLPIKNLKSQQEHQNLSDFIHSMYANFIMFFLGFIIVLTIWENMNQRAIVIKRVDDFILTLVAFEMMAATLLPFLLALKGHYPKENVSILSTCVVLSILQILDIGIVLYATFSPKLIHFDLKNWTKSDLRKLVMIMIFRPLVRLFLLVIASTFCLVDYRASIAFIGLLVFIPTINKLYWFTRRRMNKFEETKNDSFLLHFSKGNVSKECVQRMTDSAIAVIACMLIMDITVEKFPKVQADKVGLQTKLESMKLEFLAFFATFCLVSVS
ncbi:endosomal/lysosomal proton channel TMEM175-like isoform X1 [Hydra vulgaris]|uniref:endosomal/lysosomal proton channel TMEM175-like isoform X1 n=1 Tax=Hydra vulgaris TaxID=6087 RepID=UPI0032E9C8AA